MVTIDVPVDRITAEARQVNPAQAGRLLLTIIAGLLYLVGWVPAKVLGVLWVALIWSGTAVKVGWQEGRRTGSDRR